MALPNIAYIGEVIPIIEGDKLPSKCESLQRLFYHLRVDKKSLNTAVKEVIKEVYTFWSRAGIPTKKDCHSEDHLRSLYEIWRTFNKHPDRNVEKRELWMKSLSKLFDVSHADVMANVNDKRKEFLENQRKDDRVGSISDKRLSDSEEESQSASTQTVSSVRESQSKSFLFYLK